jgi:hypothetical protein
MFLMAMLYLSALTHLSTAVITSAIQAHQARRYGEISRKVKVTSQVIGLVFTAGLFFWAISSGYAASTLGLMAIVLGAGFAIAVYIGSRLAPKIGYWNILAVPLMQVALVFMLFWVVGNLSYY